jgi:ATP-dependent Clp protease ATP-binding subunit ClpA
VEFSDGVRQVIIQAEEEVRALGDSRLGSEYLLLALAADPERDVSAAVLASLGVDAPSLREQIVETNGRRDVPSPPNPPFTGEAKQVLASSFREALLLGNDCIGTEHLLLSAADGSSTAALLLADRDITPKQVRAEVLRRVTPGQQSAPRGRRRLRR